MNTEQDPQFERFMSEDYKLAGAGVMPKLLAIDRIELKSLGAVS